MKFKTYVDYTLEEFPRPFYVGKGIASRVMTFKRNKLHKSIANKYGISRQIVFETNDEKEALAKEIELISLYKTHVNGETGRWGANFTKGGEGVSGYVYSDEQKRLMSEMRQGEKHPMWGKHHSKESKRKNSESNKIATAGEKNGMFGKHHNEETRQKIGDNQRGWHHTDEAKRKISEACSLSSTGKHPSEETKRKIGAARKGKAPWNKGKKFGPRQTPRIFSEQARKNISNGCLGRVPWNKGMKKKLLHARIECYLAIEYHE